MNWGFTIGDTVFNSIDTIIMVLLLIGGIGGAITGFAVSFARSAGYVAGLFVGLAFTKRMAEKLAETFSTGAFLSSFLSFIILFALGYALLCSLGSAMEKVFSIGSGLEAVNRILGFAWNMFLALLVIGVVCYFLRLQTLWNVQNLFGNSQFITHMIDPLTPKVKELVQSQFT